MGLFEDRRAAEIYHTGACNDVSSHIAYGAWRIMRQLVKAHDIQDVRFIWRDPIQRWANSPGRLGLHIEGKWFVTFQWTETIGPSEIRLERRK